MNLDTPELTWADIEREALQCLVLQRLWHLDAMNNQLTREQLMIGTLLWFSRDRRQMLGREVDRLMREPKPQLFPPLVACRYCGEVLLADGNGGWTCPNHDSHEGRRRR